MGENTYCYPEVTRLVRLRIVALLKKKRTEIEEQELQRLKEWLEEL